MQLNLLSQAQDGKFREVKGPKVNVSQVFDGTKGDKTETFVGQVGIYLATN